MRLIYTISALGAEPVPWSVPRFGRGKRKDGTTYQFSTRGGKDKIAEGRVGLDSWQRMVKDAAKDVVGKNPPETSSLKIEYYFYAQTPSGRQHGELWDVPMVFKYNKKQKKEIWTKKNRGRYTEPDLTNLVKSTEDALQEVVFQNDVSSRTYTATCLFGPIPGVRIKVYRVEPGDFPGVGEPVK